MYARFKSRLRIFKKSVFIFIIVLLFIPFFTTEYVSGQNKKRALTIEDYYHIKTISNVSISPNGRWVVYTLYSRV